METTQTMTEFMPAILRIQQNTGAMGLALAVLAALALWTAIKAGKIAAAVWFGTRHPAAVDRMLDAYQQNGGKCFWLGLVELFGGLLVVVLLLNTHVLALLGIALFLVLAALAVIGYGVAYRNIGLRLASMERGSGMLRPTVLGGIVAECMFFLPILGQLLSLGILLKGLGAAVLGLSRREAQPVATDPPETSPQ